MIRRQCGERDSIDASAANTQPGVDANKVCVLSITRKRANLLPSFVCSLFFVVGRRRREADPWLGLKHESDKTKFVLNTPNSMSSATVR